VTFCLFSTQRQIIASHYYYDIRPFNSKKAPCASLIFNDPVYISKQMQQKKSISIVNNERAKKKTTHSQQCGRSSQRVGLNDCGN
jgi:hypothetical protein